MIRSRVATAGDPSSPLPELLDVVAVATLLSCSPRHVLRLAGNRRMPPAVRVGRLRRWSRRSIEKWIANGGSDAVEAGAR
jgi:excisionase family DNA binding protein